MIKKTILFFAIIILVSCKKDTIPKPSGFLALEYPAANYVSFDKNCPFTFEVNDAAVIKEKSFNNFEINYPKMKATLYLNYRSVNNNIKILLQDAQKLTYKHVIKADDIIAQPFVNNDNKVYGMFYSVNGNAATNAQFYVTDSTEHFVDCSVYFYAKPNYDSIYPAANFVKNDMRKLMETLKWK